MMWGHHHGGYRYGWRRHRWAGHAGSCGCNAGWHVPFIAADAPPPPFVLLPGPWWFPAI
jgi:hypothetical protein